MTTTPTATQRTELSFYEALKALAEDGCRITRAEWNNDDYGVLRDGWLMLYRNDTFYVWKVSDGDLLAKDWFIVHSTVH